MKKKETILLTNEEKIHREQKVCYICTKVFSTDNYNNKNHKVRDHCRYTGKYRGVARDICNSKCKTQNNFL